MNRQEELLSVRGLKVYYPVRTTLGQSEKYIRAVDDISFTVYSGETFGIVGESGCGKSTMGRAILRLLEPTAGEISFEGTNLFKMGKRELRQARSRMQMIFQDPMASLDPHMKVRDIIGEPLKVHQIARGKELEERVSRLLEDVGLPGESGDRFPHEFSGGQRQRIGIARALALEPKLVVCDEPVSALDVSNQAQILNLLDDLRRRHGLTYIFIAHGLAAVRYISTRIAVMYLGRLVEIGGSEEICQNPTHPYTQALLSAATDPNPDSVSERIVLPGDVPNPVDPPAGCRFHPRCPFCRSLCRVREPELAQENGRLVACHKINAPQEYERKGDEI